MSYPRLLAGIFFWMVGAANLWLILMTRKFASHWAITLMGEPRTFVGLAPAQFGLLTGVVYALSAGCCIGVSFGLLDPWLPDVDAQTFGRST